MAWILDLLPGLLEFLGLKKPNHAQLEPSTPDLKSNIVRGQHIHPLGLIAAAPLVALSSDLTAGARATVRRKQLATTSGGSRGGRGRHRPPQLPAPPHGGGTGRRPGRHAAVAQRRLISCSKLVRSLVKPQYYYCSIQWLLLCAYITRSGPKHSEVGVVISKIIFCDRRHAEEMP